MTLNVIRGVKHPPARIVVFGPPGVGKSTFACGGPNVVREDVLAVDYESGLEEIGVARVEGAKTWLGCLEQTREACVGPGEHRAVIFDTIDRIEDLATAEVCRVGVKGKTMPDLAAFGYGDGYEALLAKWREFLFVLEAARTFGREVILVAHVQSKIQDDPMLGNYSKWIAALQKKSWGSTHRWADAVLFAQYEQGMIDGRVVMTGERILRTVAGSGYDAKNRWGLPPVLPLSWAAFEAARRATQRSPGDIIKGILELVEKHPEHADKAREFITAAGSDVPKLVGIETALKKKVSA